MVENEGLKCGGRPRGALVCGGAGFQPPKTALSLPHFWVDEGLLRSLSVSPYRTLVLPFMPRWSSVDLLGPAG